ncbi:MAG: hypothetical protein M1823_001208 [Watsoniomyces obsoletus]|nr:MAG: hypothetical protein M1823_001208 [Watsoniomyces obsoletus]
MHLITPLVLWLSTVSVSVSALPLDSSYFEVPPAAASGKTKKQSGSIGIDFSNPVQWMLATGTGGLLAGMGIKGHLTKGQTTKAVNEELQKQQGTLNKAHKTQLETLKQVHTQELEMTQQQLEDLKKAHTKELQEVRDAAIEDGRKQGKIDEERDNWDYVDSEFECVEQLQRSFPDDLQLSYEQSNALFLGFHQAHMALCLEYLMYHSANGKKYFKVPKPVKQLGAPYGEEVPEVVPEGAPGVRQKVQEKEGAGASGRSAFSLPKVDPHQSLSQLQSAGGHMIKSMQNYKFVMPPVKFAPVKGMTPA